MAGFHTEEISPRLVSLKDIGAMTPYKAIVCVVNLEEDFYEIIQGITWDTYLIYAAKYFDAEWGILTNGIQLKVFNYNLKSNQLIFTCNDLDGIIVGEKVDSFYNVYKSLQAIKLYKQETRQIKPRRKRLVNKSKSIDSTRVPKGLSNILDVCEQVFVNDLDFSEAYVQVASRKNLNSIHTVADACTRRIGIDTATFRKLLDNKPELIEYLSGIYPNYSEIIRNTITRSE